jgi:hypothetical protein
MISLIDDAYKVSVGHHILFNGLSSATLTLTGSAPSVPFRVAVSLLAASDHTDLSGTVVVGGETLTFTQATRKTTTVALTSLPGITTANIDCAVLVEAISVGGAPIEDETLTAIKIRMISKIKSVPSPLGGFTSTKESYALSWASDDVDAGDIIRYGGEDFPVADIDSLRGFASSELVRKLLF